MYITFKALSQMVIWHQAIYPRDTERGAQFKRMNILESEK